MVAFPFSPLFYLSAFFLFLIMESVSIALLLFLVMMLTGSNVFSGLKGEDAESIWTVGNQLGETRI